MRIPYKMSVLTICSLALSVAGARFVGGAVAPTSVTVEQLSPTIVGSWIFSSSGSDLLQSTEPGVQQRKHVFTIPSRGQMTLTVIPPSGAGVKITTFKNGVQVGVSDVRHASATVENGDSWRFLVQYSTVSVGLLGITSTPFGISFKVKGPDGVTYVGKTPQSFENVPIGRYTIYMSAPKGCVIPPPISRKIKDGERVTAHIDFVCHARARERVRPRRNSRRQIIEETNKRNAIEAARRLRNRQFSQSGSSVSSSSSSSSSSSTSGN